MPFIFFNHRFSIYFFLPAISFTFTFWVSNYIVLNTHKTHHSFHSTNSMKHLFLGLLFIVLGLILAGIYGFWCHLENVLPEHLCQVHPPSK